MKHIKGLALLAAGTMLLACSDQSATISMSRDTLMHDQLEREHFVFLPSSYDAEAAHPLVIFMHGYGRTATGTEAVVTLGLNRYAEDAGYVMVYPQSTGFTAEAGEPGQWQVTSWNHISDGFDRGPAGPICTADAVEPICPPECGECGECGWASCHDDVGYLTKLVAHLRSELNVDDVFVAGFSNGAMMSQRVACEASTLFSAAMLIGGRVEPGFECTPTEPLPLLQINGGDDALVPADGSKSRLGYFFADTRSVAVHWSGEASCAAEQHPISLAATSGTTASCSISCAGEPNESIDCLWPEGDHRWPGSAAGFGDDQCVTNVQAASLPELPRCATPNPDAKVWGSALMFEFFDRYR